MNISTLANKLGQSAATSLAAMQYLSVATDIPEATAALQHDAFKTVSIESLIAISPKVTTLMKEASLSDGEAKTFISTVLNKLEESI